MQLEIELNDYTDDQGAFGAVLVLEVSKETEDRSGEAWGAPFHDVVHYHVVNEATLFTYDKDGGDLREIPNVDYTDFISDEKLEQYCEE